MFQISVPKSVQRGGKYFLDKKLQALVVNGVFNQQGQDMMAMISPNRLTDVLQYLSEVHSTSVEVNLKNKEESKDTGTSSEATNEATKGGDGNNSINLSIAENIKPFQGESKARASKARIQEKYPDAIVVTKESDLPAYIQDIIKSMGAEGTVTGLLDNSTGKIYMVSNHIATMGEAEGTYRHETLGHKGVIAKLGEKLDKFAMQVTQHNYPNTIQLGDAFLYSPNGMLII